MLKTVEWKVSVGERKRAAALSEIGNAVLKVKRDVHKSAISRTEKALVRAACEVDG